MNNIYAYIYGCVHIYAYITSLITKDKTYFKQEVMNVSTSGNVPQCLKMGVKSSA